MSKSLGPRTVATAGHESGVNNGTILPPPPKSLFQQKVGGKPVLMRQFCGCPGGGVTLAWRGRVEEKEQRAFQVLQSKRSAQPGQLKWTRGTHACLNLSLSPAACKYVLSGPFTDGIR